MDGPTVFYYFFDNEKRINTCGTSKSCYNRITEVFYESLSFRQRY